MSRERLYFGIACLVVACIFLAGAAPTQAAAVNPWVDKYEDWYQNGTLWCSPRTPVCIDKLPNISSPSFRARVRKRIEMRLHPRFNPYKFDGAYLAELSDKLSAVCDNRSRLIISYADAAYAPMLHNFLLSAQRAGVLNVTFVFAMDDYIDRLMDQFGVPHMLLPEVARTKGGLGKYLFMFNTLMLGYSVFLIEPDVYVGSNPFEHLRWQCDLSFQSEGYFWKDVSKEHVNIGDFFARSSVRTVSMFGEMIEQFRWDAWDQQLFNHILKNNWLRMNLTLCALDMHSLPRPARPSPVSADLGPPCRSVYEVITVPPAPVCTSSDANDGLSGGLYFWLPHLRARSTPIVTVHNSFVEPSYKIHMFHRGDLWLVQDDDAFWGGRKYLTFSTDMEKPIEQHFHALRMAALLAHGLNRTLVLPRVQCRGHPAWDLFQIRELLYCHVDHWADVARLQSHMDTRPPNVDENAALRARFLTPEVMPKYDVVLDTDLAYRDLVADLGRAPFTGSANLRFDGDITTAYDFKSVPVQLARWMSEEVIRCVGMRSWEKDVGEAGGTWSVPPDCGLSKWNWW
eukprot:tig00000144_g9002.t2